jgi:peptidoglycan L-alanyl-D-glutamate endopeptidase CwlK
VSLDAISVTRLALVDPVLAALIVQMDALLSPSGIAFRVTQGRRTWLEQDVLYAQGRTAPGPRVTNARGGESWHNLGCAVDFVPMKEGVPIWDTADPWWATIIECGEDVGLVSGSRWTEPDRPHLQRTAPYPEDAPSDEARQIYLNEGAAQFWATITG